MTTAVPLVAVVIAVLLGAHRFRPTPRRVVTGSRNPPADAGRDVTAVVADVERELRTGSSLTAALVGALDGAPPAMFSGLRRALAAGTPLAAALHVPGDRRDVDRDEALVLQALRACVATGGPMADTLERAVLVLRERAAWRADRRVQSAQARLSGHVLTLVPLVFAAWSVLSSERVRSAYSASAIAPLATAAGVALNLAGWTWMRRLVAGGVR